MPKLSVALCTYNGAKYLRPQLDSILHQTCPADEIIIVDDNSTDNTQELLKEYSDKCKGIIKYSINEETLGFLKNFSFAIKKTTGDFVALADQDDIWAENHLELLLMSIGEKAICAGNSRLIDSCGNAIGCTFYELRGNNIVPDDDVLKAYKIIYHYNSYRGADMLINRKWVEKYLPIPSEVIYHDTYLALCASLSSGLTVIKDVISSYRIHNEQATSTLLKVRFIDEIKRRRHFICSRNKINMIELLLEREENLSPQALAFISEFYHIQELDKEGKRIQILRLLYRHF